MADRNPERRNQIPNIPTRSLQHEHDHSRILTNMSATTASTSTILVVDLDKYKGVACLHDPDSGEFCFTTFAGGFRALVRHIFFSHLSQ
jgi:hypothetical protein